jgi:hypothetical protein
MAELPKFKNEEEWAEFFDTHDMSESGNIKHADGQGAGVGETQKEAASENAATMDQPAAA